MNLRPSGYEPDELPDCSTPRPSRPSRVRSNSNGCHCEISAGLGLPSASGSRALRRPGDDLLSHASSRSTIGAEGFHGRVRDGIGCRPLAMTTRPSKRATDESLGTRFRKLARPSCFRLAAAHEARIKPLERLVPVSFMRCRTFTPGLSTWWSSTALKGELVSRGASRLDAFSGYPFRT